MAFQPPSAHLQTRVVATGPSTTAVVSQNFLRASARSKSSLTQIDSLRASYPLKLLSPASVNTALRSSPLSSPAAIHDSSTSTSPTAVLSLPPPPRIVYMITYGGGLLADDHPDLQLVVTRHARLLVLGQGNTKIYKSPRVDHPPASQTLHSTVGPGAVLLFLGPPVVACEDSSVFLRHEILLQAQRPSHPQPRLNGGVATVNGQGDKGDDMDDELPNCVVLDWIAGGRGEEERWKARRSEWRLIVRWAELEAESATSLSKDSVSASGPTTTKGTSLEKGEEEREEEEEEEFVDEEDPRDVADRMAGGPVIFRDGFLIEHNPPLPSKPSLLAEGYRSISSSMPAPSTDSSTVHTPARAGPAPVPKMTSYAPSLYPHSTIGSLFIMGPKTERLQRSILRRFEQITVYPGQKAEQRTDYPILWSATVVQVPRPPPPASSTVPRRKRTMMNAMVVKMASQGIEQMQEFLKSLFEETVADIDPKRKMMDSDDESDDQREGGGSKKRADNRTQDEKGLSVIDELFGGRTVWERAFR
ncbi:hypothetical protein BGZ67_002642 [Mortierella alpina]|nr:hypothetical protein BGZ67_002642 [Mortierella alpina]